MGPLGADADGRRRGRSHCSWRHRRSSSTTTPKPACTAWSSAGALTVLSLTSLLRRPSLWNAVGRRCSCCGSLYSHYWTLYSVALLGIGLAWCAWKGPYQRACRYGLVAVAVGCLSFVPWLPTLLFQTRHTGTPWAAPAQLTAVVYTMTQFAGGDSDPGRALAAMFFFFGVLGVFGAPLNRAGSSCSTSALAQECGCSPESSSARSCSASSPAGSTGRRLPIATPPPFSSPPSSSSPTASRPSATAGPGSGSWPLPSCSRIPGGGSQRLHPAHGRRQGRHCHPGRGAAGATSSPTAPTSSGRRSPAVLAGRFDEITFPRDSPPEIVEWGRLPEDRGGRLDEGLRSQGRTTGRCERNGLLRLGAPLQRLRGRSAQDGSCTISSPGPVTTTRCCSTPSKPTRPSRIYEGSTLDRFTPAMRTPRRGPDRLEGNGSD